MQGVMRGLTRADAAVAAGFVVAAGVESLVLHRGVPALQVFALTGAPVLAVLALRRIHPATPLALVAAFAVLGTTVQRLRWPHADDSGGVWMVALLVAAYSLGAYGRGRTVALGGVLPLVVVLAIDVPTMDGWSLVSGVVFVSAFVGLLPTAVGRLVRVRRDRLALLTRQRARLMSEQQVRAEAAVLGERVRAAERLRPALLDGMAVLAGRAEAGADAGELEQGARELLGRTRAEVVALTAPVQVPAAVEPRPVDHLALLRRTAQRWIVLGAGAIGVGLALESTGALRLTAPDGVAVLASLVVVVPFALLWARPLMAASVGWCAVAAYTHLVAPLDGALSETALALAASFTLGALTTRRSAVVGLVLCWLGQVLGADASDPFGVCVILGVSWLGGVVVNEVSRLVEQSRANNQALVGADAFAAQRAVVEERLRLAREIHDQLGHSLTVMVLQAGAARRIAVSDPAHLAEVRATIAQAARDGLAAMRGEAGSDLASLLDRTRAAGLDVKADVDVMDELLDPLIRSLVHRVVQEALTNVLRHAPGAHASVVVRRDGAEAITVEVANGPPDRVPTHRGNGGGLVGLRESLAGCAGVVQWNRREDGGFAVRATLPATSLAGAFG